MPQLKTPGRDSTPDCELEYALPCPSTVKRQTRTYETPSKRNRIIASESETVSPSKRRRRSSSAGRELAELGISPKPQTKTKEQKLKQRFIEADKEVLDLPSSQEDLEIVDVIEDYNESDQDRSKQKHNHEDDGQKNIGRTGPRLNKGNPRTYKDGDKRQPRYFTSMVTNTAKNNGTGNPPVGNGNRRPRLLQKRDPISGDLSGTTVAGDEVSDEDVGEAIRRSLLDQEKPPPQYQTLHPEHVHASTPTPPNPPLPHPDQVPTLGHSNVHRDLHIEFKIEHIPVGASSVPAKLITVRFPMHVVGSGIEYSVSEECTSILLVWNRSRNQAPSDMGFDRMHSDDNHLVQTSRGKEGMGKIEIPKGWSLMPTTDKVKKCDTGSGFSKRRWLIGISREKGKLPIEAWVVVRVGIVKQGVGWVSLLSKEEEAKSAQPKIWLSMQDGKLSSSPLKPVNRNQEKTVNPIDLDRRRTLEVVGNVCRQRPKSLWEAIESGSAEEKRGLLKKPRQYVDSNDDGMIEEEVESGSPNKKLKLEKKGGRVDSAADSTARSLENAGDEVHEVIVLGVHPKVVIPVTPKSKQKRERKEKEKEQEKEKEKAVVGKQRGKIMNRNIMHKGLVHDPGDISLEGEDVFGIVGGGLYIPDVG